MASPPAWLASAERVPALGAQAKEMRLARGAGIAKLALLDALFDQVAQQPATAAGIREAARLLDAHAGDGADPRWAGSGTNPGAALLHHAGVALLVDLTARACAAGRDPEVARAADEVRLPPLFHSGGHDAVTAERDRGALKDAARACAAAPAGPDVAFTIVENLEMVPYCLPVPSSHMTEDVHERWEHGRKVFVTRGASPTAAGTARMDLSGFCGASSLADLRSADVAAITRASPGVRFTVDALRPASYALSWRAGGLIHYGKVWAAKDDPGCFVRAMFEYSTAEQALFDVIVTKVAGSDPTCPRPP